MARKSRRVSRKKKGGQEEPVNVEDIKVGNKYRASFVESLVPEERSGDNIVTVTSKEELENSDPTEIKVIVNDTTPIFYGEGVNEGSKGEQLFEIPQGGRRKRKLKRSTRRKHL